MPATRRAAALSAVLLAAGLLSGCASDTATETATSAPAASSAAAATCPLTVTDTWVKAQDTEMTGSFGTFANETDAAITVVAASSPQAGKVEIHEVVDKDGAMVMQPKAGGLVVPAGGSATLKPGSDHLMLMELPAPIEPGDDVEISIECDNGGTLTWTSVAKPFEGGDETYAPSMESMEPTESPAMESTESMSPSPES